MRTVPSLSAIAAAFTAIGLQSWGGGMTAWIRREVVVRRRWVEERPFLAVLTICQIAPGPNVVNLAAMIGTMLRGTAGALAALLGMVGPPAVLVVVLGAGLVAFKDIPGLGSCMAGLGAAAIGLTLANAISMTRQAVSGPAAAVVIAAVAVAFGLLGVPLLVVLVVALPASMGLAAWRRR
jgi:chromate transporter